MREVIQKIVASETGAKRQVQAAQAEAEQLVADARSQARLLLEQANRDAKLTAENVLAIAETEAAQEKSERLVRAAAEINATILLDESQAQAAVAAALRCVCGLPAAGAPDAGAAHFQGPP
jgi:vacuolar-type H+-ATPase subunit H